MFDNDVGHDPVGGWIAFRCAVRVFDHVHADRFDEAISADLQKLVDAIVSASNEARMVTGQAYNICGGVLLY